MVTLGDVETKVVPLDVERGAELDFFENRVDPEGAPRFVWVEEVIDRRHGVAAEVDEAHGDEFVTRKVLNLPGVDAGVDKKRLVLLLCGGAFVQGETTLMGVAVVEFEVAWGDRGATAFYTEGSVVFRPCAAL